MKDKLTTVCIGCGERFPATDEYFYKWGSRGYSGLINKCKKCKRGENNVRYKNNREVNILRSRQIHSMMKLQAINHYGGKCRCCGEDNIAFLTIDHINGGGTEHRRKIGYGGGAIYRWLKRNNYPSGFQVLCANCNQAKFICGICPHQLAKEEVK